MNRRIALKSMLCSAVAVSLGACDDHADTSAGRAARYPSIPPLSGTSGSRETLHALLEDLRQAYEQLGQPVSKDLMPPLDAAQLRQQCAWFPGAIPDELYWLYAWRGGQREGNADTVAPFWFRDMIFSTPDAAAREYRSMVEHYGPYAPAEDVGVDLRTCFPFAAFNGGWYVFPCAGQALDLSHPRAIICVFQGIDVYFHSLESMLRTCIAWVRHPLYQGEPREWEAIEIELWRKHNPGVFE